MSFDPPTGHEREAPPGLDRYESLRWWSAWRLARAAQATSTGLGALAQDHFIAHPTKPCPARCDHGVANGTTCSACRGLSYVPMTVEEMREEFRVIRSRVVDDYPITEEEFHTRVSEVVTERGADAPGFWLDAARTVEKRLANERDARRQKVRALWG